MWRTTFLALLLCAGCASTGDTLLDDGLWGDVRTLFSDNDHSYNLSATNAPAAKQEQGQAPVR